MTEKPVYPPPGIYTLAKDVTNPQPDRRARYDWTLSPVWRAGSRWVIKHRHGDTGRLEINSLGAYDHKAIGLFVRHTPEDYPIELAVCTEVVKHLVPDESREAEFHFWFLSQSHEKRYAYNLLQQAFLERRIDLTWLSETEERFNREYDAEEEKKKGVLEGNEDANKDA